MFARVSTIQGKPEQAEDGIRNYREQVMPAAKKMAGFKGAYLHGVGYSLEKFKQELGATIKYIKSQAKATGVKK